MDETCPDSRIMKYKPGERFGEWLILGRSTKLQTNGKRNFRWCMCLGCKRPYRVRIGNLATGSTSACQSCSNSGSNRLDPRERLKRRFREGRKRISKGLIRKELLRWKIPIRLTQLWNRKHKNSRSGWVRKCVSVVYIRRYKPKGNDRKERVFNEWKDSIPNEMAKAGKRYRERRRNLDPWITRCIRADTRCRQRQKDNS